jgi:hypothetical protein
MISISLFLPGERLLETAIRGLLFAQAFRVLRLSGATQKLHVALSFGKSAIANASEANFITGALRGVKSELAVNDKPCLELAENVNSENGSSIILLPRQHSNTSKTSALK